LFLIKTCIFVFLLLKVYFYFSLKIDIYLEYFYNNHGKWLNASLQSYAVISYILGIVLVISNWTQT